VTGEESLPPTYILAFAAGALLIQGLRVYQGEREKIPLNNGAVPLTDQAMAKLTKAILTKKIQERTGLSRRKAQRGLKEALESMKIALQMGKEVQLPGIGRLVVVERPRQRVIRKNMKGHCPASIVELHKKHPRSVRILGAKDMSENPLPTIVHKKEPEPLEVPARSRSFRVAVPSWRRRFR
jgi:nucleoid DNA-binding protein